MVWKERGKTDNRIADWRQTTSFMLALVGAASALVARSPLKVDTGNTLIEYQPWCPVCDTVALNEKCIAEHASCRGSVFKYVSICSSSEETKDHTCTNAYLYSSHGISECETGCNTQCQRLPNVANSDYGYSCNVTRSATPVSGNSTVSV